MPVAPAGAASAGGPGRGVAAGHRGGVARLEAWAGRLAETPRHGGGAAGEGGEATPVDLGGPRGVERGLPGAERARQRDIDRSKMEQGRAGASEGVSEE